MNPFVAQIFWSLFYTALLLIVCRAVTLCITVIIERLYAARVTMINLTSDEQVREEQKKRNREGIAVYLNKK